MNGLAASPRSVFDTVRLSSPGIAAPSLPCTLCAAVCAFLLFAAVSAASAPDNRRVGVVPSAVQVPNAEKNWLVAVGINRYEDERVNALRFCKADAEAIHAYFTQGGVVPPANAYLLVTGSADPRFLPTRLNILESVQYAARAAGPDSTIIIFCAGHGFVDTDGKSYLLPQDGKISLLRDTAVSIERINEILRESASKRKVLFMDACRNAPTRDSRGAMDEKRTQMFLEALKASAGQVTLAACNEGESSLEDAETGHGVFTLHVLRGLMGAAQADPNGLINVSTLQQYLSQKVPAWALKRRKPVQRPWMWGEMSAPIPLAVAGRGPILVPLVDSPPPGGAEVSTPRIGEDETTGIMPPVAPPPARYPVGWIEALSVGGILLIGIATPAFLLRRRRKKKAAALKKETVSQTAVLFPAEAQTRQRLTEILQKIDALAPTDAPPPGDPLLEAMQRARLVLESPKPGRKILFLVKPRLAVGVNRFTKDPRVDLTLRFLPCRSREQDTENWTRNRLISSPHFTIEARKDHFAIRDEKNSKNGISLIELRGGGDDPSHSVGDTETVFETPSMMEEAGEVFPPGNSTLEGRIVTLPKGVWTPIEERCAITIGHRVMTLHAQTFSSKRLGLYALRLKRADNLPSLEYVLLIRRAYIGSDPKCPVRIPDPAFPRLAAALDFKKGVFFLVTGQGEMPVFLNGQAVGKSRAVPLTHVSRIEIGKYRWRFEAASIEDFTEA